MIRAAQGWRDNRQNNVLFKEGVTAIYKAEKRPEEVGRGMKMVFQDSRRRYVWFILSLHVYTQSPADGDHIFQRFHDIYLACMAASSVSLINEHFNSAIPPGGDPLVPSLYHAKLLF